MLFWNTVRPDSTAKSEPHISFQIQYITRKWTLTLLAGCIATYARRQKPPSIRWPTAAQCFVAPSGVWRSSPPGTAGTARGPANGSSTWRLLQRRSCVSSSQSALRSAGKHSERGCLLYSLWLFTKLSTCLISHQICQLKWREWSLLSPYFSPETTVSSIQLWILPYYPITLSLLQFLLF